MRLRVLVALVVVVVAAGPAPVAWADEGGLSGVEDGEVLPEDVAQGFDVQEDELFFHASDIPEAGNFYTQQKQRLQCNLAEAATGNMEMQYWCGWALQHGMDGLTKDLEHAMEWYRKAADAGHVGAMNNLGVGYTRGTGVPQDDHQAAKWFRSAAGRGHGPAMNNWASALGSGKGIDKNAHLSVFWFEKAAEKGEVGAMYNLGLAYQYGVGVRQSLETAKDWLGKAGARGHKLALFQIGDVLEQQRRPDEALQFYRLAATKGLPDARASVARLEAAAEL